MKWIKKTETWVNVILERGNMIERKMGPHAWVALAKLPFSSNLGLQYPIQLQVFTLGILGYLSTIQGWCCGAAASSFGGHMYPILEGWFEYQLLLIWLSANASGKYQMVAQVLDFPWKMLLEPLPGCSV